MLGACSSSREMDGSTKIERVVASDKQQSADPLSSPPLKRQKQLVQARLPFKVLTPKPPALNVVSPNTKKRKLSENSNSCTQKASKAAKNSDEQSKKPTQKKPCIVSHYHDNAENEVSSSSEADTTLKSDSEDAIGTKLPVPKGMMSLDKFVRTTQQLEVTTSCIDHQVIDLTDSDSEIAGKEVNITKADTSKDKVTGENTEKADDEIVQTCTKISELDQQTDKKSKLQEKTTPEKKEQKSGTSPQVSPETKQRSNKEQSNKLSESGNEDKLTEPKNQTSPSSASKPKQKTPVSHKKVLREVEKQKKLEEKERLKVEKQKQKEEAQKQKEEAKAEKERLRKEEKERKEKEKQELKEQKEKDKQAKLEQQEKEKAEKLRIKEEERRKKQEMLDAKSEEKRRKEEEKRKKEEEKQKALEEEARKKERTSAVFHNFFVKPANRIPEEKVDKEEKGPFMAFEVKKDMRIAPVVRVKAEEKEVKIQALDAILKEQNGEAVYLRDLKTGKHQPGSASKTYPSDIKKKEEESDEVIMDEEQKAIAEPEVEKLPLMKVKLLQFHENYRPPYYGTWRKKTKYIQGRNPFSKDDVLLDYDIDSDEEWEEEEPGESLSHSEGEDEDEKKDNSDEEDDDGFFVPHGYLSEGEGGEDEDDEEMSPERLKAKQLAKAKAWEVEMQKQVNVLRAIIIGCCWYNREGPMTPQREKLESFKAVPLVSTPIVTTTESNTEQASTSSKKSKDKDGTGKKQTHKQSVPDEAMTDLVRFVHGNKNGIGTLLQEFREYWRRKSIGLPLTRSPGEVPVEKEKGEDSNEKVGRDSPMDISGTEEESQQEGDQSSPRSDNKAGCLISKRQLGIMIRSIATWQKGSHGTSWYVKESTLEYYGLKDLELPNQWEYITYIKPKKTKTPKVVSSAVCTSSSSPGLHSPAVTASPTTQLTGNQGPAGGKPQEISGQPSILTAFAATPKAVRPTVMSTPSVCAPKDAGVSPLQQRAASAFTAGPGGSTITPVKSPAQNSLLKGQGVRTITPVKGPAESPLLKAFAIQGANTPKSTGKGLDNDCIIVGTTKQLPMGPSPRRIIPTLLQDNSKSQLTSPGSTGTKQKNTVPVNLTTTLKETRCKPSVTITDILKTACVKPAAKTEVNVKSAHMTEDSESAQ